MTYPGIHAERDPDRIALVMGRSGETLAYAQLDGRSNQLARTLRRRGLGVGDHVALLMENDVRYLEVVWAALRSGLYVTPINSHLTPDEVGYIVRDCGATGLVTSRALAEVATRLDPEAMQDVTVRLMTNGAVDGFVSYEDCIAAEPTERLADERSGGFMFYTSGTTGHPKGVLRPLENTAPWEWEPRHGRLAELYGFRADMRYLSLAPAYHAAPLGSCTNVGRFGGTVVMMERFDAAHSLRLIEEHCITHSQWVPSMFVKLLHLDDDERCGPDLSSHEVAVHAAAPCPVEIKRRMIEWWGPILYEYYSGTERVGMTYITSAEWLRHPGSVGRAISGTVHIVGEDGGELAPGEIGAVYFGDGPSFEYHGDSGKTAGAHLANGWATMGDVGYVDGEGHLYLTDRKAFTIIAGGVNIYPQEVEDVFVLHPSVEDVAVFGVPNEVLGEEVKAVVQLREGIEPSAAVEADLYVFARERLAAFKCPRSIDFDSQLPRLPTGKLYKRVLRDRYWPAQPVTSRKEA